MTDQNSSKQRIIINLIKTFVFVLLAFGAAFGTLYLEKQYANGEVIQEKDVFKGIDVEMENVIPNYGLMRFDVDEDNEVVMNSVLQEEGEYVFEMNEGRMWGNFEISDAKVNIKVGKVILIPNRAQFDLEFDGSRIVISVYGGDVYLGFLEEDMEYKQYVDEYSTLFMNRFLVPKDTMVTIPISRIDERIKPLLFSKLVKEFKYSAIPDADKEMPWFVDNVKADERFIESVRQEFNSGVLFNGEVIGDDVWDELMFSLKENLTFIPDKKKERLFEKVFAYLDNAIFYYYEGDFELGAENYTSFEILLDSSSKDIVESDDFYEEFDQRLEKMLMFGPDNNYRELYLDMLDQKFKNKLDVFDIVNRLWINVYRAIDVDEALAEESLDIFYNYFDQSLREITDLDFKRNYLVYYNQLFDNLFLRYATFHKDKYFAIKLVLENQLLETYDPGQLRDELTQSFIANKISFLKRMRTFFFDGEITVEQAKILISRLIKETEDYLEDDRSEAAVVDFFESELEDVGDFWGYLNSPEYYSSPIYGLTHRERYATYVAETEQIWNFIDVQNDLNGDEQVEQIDLMDIEREISNAFSGIAEVEMGDVNEVNQRFIDISGQAGGYDFEAVYDRSSGKIKDVIAYDEMIADRAVNIDTLIPLLDKKFADLIGDEEVFNENDITEESNAQRVARVFILNKILDAGFVVELEDITIVDEGESIYRVDEILLEDYPDIIFSFDFDASMDKASDLYLVIRGKPVVLSDDYTLEELKQVGISQSEEALREERAEYEAEVEDADTDTEEGLSEGAEAESEGRVTR